MIYPLAAIIVLQISLTVQQHDIVQGEYLEINEIKVKEIYI